jgi:O-antigen ligase
MSMSATAVVRAERDWLDDAGFWTLASCAGALQVSIAAAQILLAVALVIFAVAVVIGRRPIEAPAFFLPLVAYAGLSLVAAVFSVDPRASLIDSKQLLLFLVVPAVVWLARGPRRSNLIVLVIITVGAAEAVHGIYQYAILKYDFLGRRPQGAMSHYMTYSGLLMLVACAAVARLLFHRTERTWPALVLPALAVALAVTFTRSAWIGACVAAAVLLALKDFRLVAALPVVAALFVAFAPVRLTDRVYSMFDLNDPTNRDRVAMMRAGVRIIRDHPLTGAGPDTILAIYPRYRDEGAVQAVNPHLHNVPMQIAAERGLPALAAWIWFVAALLVDLARRFRAGRAAALAATALAATVSMLAAGLFEHNFGDSEFLMLFLVLITLPFAADRPDPASA